MGWFNRTIRSLSAQLIALFTLALLPLGLISIAQTRQVVEEANALARASLLAQTVAAASEERSLLQNAFGAAQGLGATVLSTRGPEACSESMRSFIAAYPQYKFAGFIPADGVMLCSTSDTVVDLSANESVQRAIASGEPSVVVSARGAVTGLPVFVVRHPVFSGGATRGYIAISIPLSTMNELSETRGADGEDLRLATINATGEIVAATDGIEGAAEFLPRDIPLMELTTRANATFPAIAGDGSYRHFAIAPLIDEEVVLVGSWPAERIGGAVPGWSQSTAIAFPILMWLVGIAVAYFGARRLVVRHIEALRSAMRRFALGERSAKSLRLDAPPGELADAERAFNRMALIITDAELRREADLRDKEVLLKEVHHRVKNNLQLIASIMNMQARNARSPETRMMLAGLQQRVRGLAMLHRTLYTTPEMTTVDGSDLFRTVVNDVTQALDADDLSLKQSLDRVDLYPDQAVPLSMLLAEAVTNAVKHTGRTSDGRAEIEVTLQNDEDGSVRFTVSNTKGQPLPGRTAPDEAEPSGLGTRLMAAFVAQLDGTAELVDTDDRYTYTVAFQRRDFEPSDTESSAA